MARKTTYRHKHAGKFDNPEHQAAPIQISDTQRAAFEEGRIIVIDKPLHWTSFDIIRKLRGMIRVKKIGHAGTLDPLATGVLIVCTGKFTKKINEIMAGEKEYTGTFTLGAVTPTYDLESNPEQPKAYEHITEADLIRCKNELTGTILQKPPVYSAIKKQGVAAYELARRGEDVDLKPREIHIHEFELTKLALPLVHFRVVCSTGTYIRSLAHDFGAALGCGAYLSSLRRTRSGDFKIESAQTIEDFSRLLISDAP